MNEYFEKMINEFGFEKREGQIQMSELIEKNLENGNSCIVEAGTGIGKTFSYLLPAVIYAKKYKKRVVVSTNTINLQEQLIEKDIPLLEKILGEKIKYSLVKGRNNYVCGNRLMRNCTDDDLINWYKKTKTGDKSEIDFYINPQTWDMIKGDKDYCINSRCRNTNNCFYYKSKEKVNDSEILIVNHALLFTHFKYDKVLPEFEVLIFDEAHNIENVARSYFETSINSKELGINFGMIYNNRAGTGLIKKFTNISEIYVDFIGAINSLYQQYINLFDNIRLELISLKTSSIRVDKLQNLDRYNENINKILDKFKDFEDISKVLIENSEDEELNQEYMMYYSKINESIDFLNELQKKDIEKVDWVNFNENTGIVKIVRTPLDISDLLKNIYDNLKVIMTSATLRVGGSFSYIEKRLGLENFNKYFVVSPFDYDKNMKIFISNNRYDPNSNEYLEFAINKINEYVENKNEGTFILCTSYKQVEILSKGLKLKNFNILVQGQMSRNMMINEFKKEKSILIGTDSFWEGVDVKGDRLKNIIIVKIPFLVPNDPVTEALIEDISKKGLNPFMSYQLPQAIIKLQQGVGRLIRSKTDSGNIVLLDSRIKSKSYGKIILNSLSSKSIELMV